MGQSAPCLNEAAPLHGPGRWQSRHPAQVPSNVPSMKADVPSMRCAAAHDGRSLGSLPSHLALEPRHAARPHRSSQR
ncbi:hypothetical protein G6F57_014111 [Rhizopus arrhizus]|nr:hypothetical protein G6F57_014111 [Rhizopus arrhizus]KAG1475598.1 hypothetical protein G6F54_014226 [Rhizopus delemar]